MTEQAACSQGCHMFRFESAALGKVQVARPKEPIKSRACSIRRLNISLSHVLRSSCKIGKLKSLLPHVLLQQPDLSELKSSLDQEFHSSFL